MSDARTGISKFSYRISRTKEDTAPPKLRNGSQHDGC